MKNTLKTLLIGGSLAAALGLAQNSWSMGHAHDMEFDASRTVERMADRLDMSDEQRAKIEAILEAGGEQTTPDRERLQELKQLMHAQAANFDAGEAQTLADEIGEISGRLSYSLTAGYAEIYQLLDEEQRQQMDEWREQREARRGKWRRHQRGERD